MFCNKIKSRIRQVLQQYDSYVNEHIDTALKITTTLKKILASPVADIVTELIPGEVDNIIRMHLLGALDKAITALLIIDACKEHEAPADKLQCFVQQLQKQPKDVQDALLQKLASLLTRELDGQRLKQHLYDVYTQAVFTANKA